MDSRKFIMIKVIERNNNPNDNFINCNRRRQANLNIESNITQQSNLDTLFYSSSSSSCSSSEE